MSLFSTMSTIVCLSICKYLTFSFFSPEPYLPNFNQTKHKTSLGKGNSILFKWRAMPFSKLTLKQNREYTLTEFKNLLLHNDWASLNWIWRKDPWVKGSKVCSNEEICPFQRGDYSKIAKIHWQKLKIFISKTTGQISTKLSTKYLWVKEILSCSPFQEQITETFNLPAYIIIVLLKFVYCLEFLDHVSHSGDLVLWVGVRRRPSFVVR